MQKMAASPQVCRATDGPARLGGVAGTGPRLDVAGAPLSHHFSVGTSARQETESRGADEALLLPAGAPLLVCIGDRIYETSPRRAVRFRFCCARIFGVCEYNNMLLLGARTAGPDSPLDTSPTSSDKPGQFLQQLIQINDSPLQPRTQLTQVNVSSRRLVEIMRLAR